MKSDTVHGIIPNIFSKEKFVYIINIIKKQHKIDDDIYNSFYCYGGAIDYPSGFIEDQLVKSLEIMFMDNGVISSFIYDYNFCDNEEMKIEINTTNDNKTDTAMYKICDAETLYDYLIDNMKISFDYIFDSIKKEEENNKKYDTATIENFVKIFESVYGGSDDNN